MLYTSHSSFHHTVDTGCIDRELSAAGWLYNRGPNNVRMLRNAIALHAYMHTYVCASVHVCVHVYVRVFTSTCMCVYVCVCTCLYVCLSC